LSDNKSPKVEAMEDRVDAARNKIIAEREAMRVNAPKLTKQMLQGVEYEEEFPVKLANGDVGLLTIRAMAEGELVEVFADMGLERLGNLGQNSELSVEDYDFFWSVVAASSGYPKALIKRSFAMGESSIVGQRILEISGFGANTGDQVEKFPSE